MGLGEGSADKKIKRPNPTVYVLDLDGSTPEPLIRSGDTGQRIPGLAAVN